MMFLDYLRGLSDTRYQQIYEKYKDTIYCYDKVMYLTDTEFKMDRDSIEKRNKFYADVRTYAFRIAAKIDIRDSDKVINAIVGYMHEWKRLGRDPFKTPFAYRYAKAPNTDWIPFPSNFNVQIDRNVVQNPSGGFYQGRPRISGQINGTPIIYNSGQLLTNIFTNRDGDEIIRPEMRGGRHSSFEDEYDLKWRIPEKKKSIIDEWKI